MPRTPSMSTGSVSGGRKLKTHLDYLRSLDYIPKAHIDFFGHIAKAHQKAKTGISEQRPYPSITGKRAHQMLSQDFPLINSDRMRLKIRPLRTHLKEICGILSKYEKTRPNPIDSFLKSDHFKKLDPKQLIKKMFSHDAHYFTSLSEKTGVEENTLKFMALTLARPFFEVAASELKDRLKDNSWWKNSCPMCGSEPFMAKIQRGEGHRILKCSLCGSEWKFSRVKCPFCNNEDQKSMRFFFYHKRSPHRLYVCDKCNRYIKCVDERKIADRSKSTDLLIEDMATLYLDVLAKEKGCVSSWVSKP